MTAPNEVLALGERIVSELKLRPRGDMLGRWLAHYIAELLIDEKSATDAERPEIDARLVDTILKFWDQRRKVPGDVHPLSHLESVIGIMRLLSADAWPYNRRRDDIDDAMVRVFNGLRSILVHGAELAIIGSNNSLDAEGAESRLDSQEREIMAIAHKWLREATKETREDCEALPVDQMMSDFLDLHGQSQGRLRDKIDAMIRALPALKHHLSQQSETEEEQRS